jgi:hypothetical protein
MSHAIRIPVLLAFLVAIVAASPATLEAQRRQPTGMPRPARVWSHSGETTCASKKLLTVGGMTLLGSMVGAFARMFAYMGKLYTHSNAPVPNFVGVGALVGFTVGVVGAVAERCDR